MRLLARITLLLLGCAACVSAEAQTIQLPEVSPTVAPWVRWWWPASAVERTEITRQLEILDAAGIGGVEITPIYGARGYENRAIEFLSPRWMEMLEHTAREAERLGMGVDMATGTGWPFGGPEVSIAQGSSSALFENGRLRGNPTGMKVKRAAPGGEGLVLDPYATDALDAYLDRFTRALAAVPRGLVRSQFHDSFEYYQASWTPRLAEEFQRLHGYDLQKYAADLAGKGTRDADTTGRIAGDYRRTLAKLHLDYVNRWVSWSHAQGFQRAQPGAWGAGQSARSLRRGRHSGDRILWHDGAADRGTACGNGIRASRSRSAAQSRRPLRFFGRARCGQAADLERDADLAAREFPRDARGRQAADRSPLRCRHQSHLLSRRDLFACRCAVAWLVLLRRHAAR